MKRITQLPSNTIIPLDINVPRIYYVFQGLGSCAVSLPISVITDCQPEVTLTKSAQDVFCRADEEIIYELTVINTGNVPLTTVALTDVNIDAAIDVIDLIEPGDQVIIAVSHAINNIDRLYGVIINSATVLANVLDVAIDATVEDVSDDVDDPSTADDDPTIIFQDTDCDGIIDMDDIDDDNDGILDVVENNGIDPTSDADGDGVSQYLDLDDNDDSVGANPDNVPNLDTDGDNIPNHLDIDADGDGIPDNVESQDTVNYIVPLEDDPSTPSIDESDMDLDGLNDAYSPNGITPIDTDNDSIPDYLDLDSDNDNVPDTIEGHDYNHDGYPDTTSEGVDTDNDGLDDGYEGSDVNDPYDVNDEINDPTTLPDTDDDVFDVDGNVDYRDTDDDNDDILTIDEDNNEDGLYANDDCDEDGIPDYLDIDPCFIEMPDGFSPNDDDVNNVFEVEGLVNLYPNFSLQIYDRYGNIVYAHIHDGSRTSEAKWDGISTGRWTLSKDAKVPVGTYFYILNPNVKGVKSETGWLYLNKYIYFIYHLKCFFKKKWLYLQSVINLIVILLHM